ncbi:uncharacterized protein BDR25DRAFT_314752 [Lindgomyces ingoldianus]|uniref:Uncharacterized protein n=1 Tax=Lindgomyces ingoldianus TaxID=673940 RepID=A0ACB6QT11_9PLEO|nr:uncharacterized protein BDR25DRAFT_314752 [Lindgomyces ingoldianus]KAF2469982.1 hypothetical protein BDR25DRAFT_314752 [Lindgomyces ingoldianus]
MITFGISLAAVLNNAAERHQSSRAATWQITMGLSFIFAVVLSGGIFFASKTPIVYRKGNPKKAKAVMTKVYGVSDNHYSVVTELEEIRVKLQAEETKGKAVQEWINMWKAPKMAYQLALGRGLQMLQQLTGANYFFYYGTTIFTCTGINNSFVTQMILAPLIFGMAMGVCEVDGAESGADEWEGERVCVVGANPEIEGRLERGGEDVIGGGDGVGEAVEREGSEEVLREKKEEEAWCEHDSAGEVRRVVHTKSGGIGMEGLQRVFGYN